MIESGSLWICCARSRQIVSLWAGSGVVGAFWASSSRLLIRSSGEATPGKCVGGVPSPVHMGIFSSQPDRPSASRPKVETEIVPHRCLGICNNSDKRRGYNARTIASCGNRAKRNYDRIRAYSLSRRMIALLAYRASVPMSPPPCRV